jgi:hypothetical protein
MYTLRFADGEHATFGCLACSRSFVSKAAVQRHFDRNPSHDEITITGADIGGTDPTDVPDARRGGEERSGGIKR